MTDFLELKTYSLISCKLTLFLIQNRGFNFNAPKSLHQRSVYNRNLDNYGQRCLAQGYDVLLTVNTFIQRESIIHNRSMVESEAICTNVANGYQCSVRTLLYMRYKHQQHTVKLAYFITWYKFNRNKVQLYCVNRID